ncbi:MAG: PD-(D/E)XK nuclease family protein [Candidatus Omnitrophica bacterium]|nr:PD-(D/E)XK nuclease family protein [Candidatus Omnitrophota bacterium]
MEKRNEKIGLSAHSLNIFNECPKCFYLSVKEGFSRPRGPMPSIATGIDSLIKEYFEFYRKKEKLPPFLIGKIEGKLISTLKKTYYYDIEENKNYYLWGRLDEIIQTPEGFYVPLDHKTRASLPPKGDPHHAYQFQLGIYSLLLKKENKGNEVDFGYLVYYYPEKSMTDYEADKIRNIINFNFEVKKVELDIKYIKTIIKDAIKCLDKNMVPERGPNCEYCDWVENIKIYYFEKEEKKEREKLEKVDLNKEEIEFPEGKLF